MNEELELILATIEEARRKIGVRRFRNIKKAKKILVKRKGKGRQNLVHKAKKIKRAIRKGPVHNRHR